MVGAVWPPAASMISCTVTAPRGHGLPNFMPSWTVLCGIYTYLPNNSAYGFVIFVPMERRKRGRDNGCDDNPSRPHLEARFTDPADYGMHLESDPENE